MTLELGGQITIACEKTGYSAQLEFRLKVQLCFVVEIKAAAFDMYHLCSYLVVQVASVLRLCLFLNDKIWKYVVILTVIWRIAPNSLLSFVLLTAHEPKLFTVITVH